MIVGVRQSFPLYMMNKFSGQDGDTNLSSPIMVRWAEVVLNRAEAQAKLGNEAGALLSLLQIPCQLPTKHSQKLHKHLFLNAWLVVIKLFYATSHSAQ